MATANVVLESCRATKWSCEAEHRPLPPVPLRVTLCRPLSLYTVLPHTHSVPIPGRSASADAVLARLVLDSGLLTNPAHRCLLASSTAPASAPRPPDLPPLAACAQTLTTSSTPTCTQLCKPVGNVAIHPDFGGADGIGTVARLTIGVPSIAQYPGIHKPHKPSLQSAYLPCFTPLPPSVSHASSACVMRSSRTSTAPSTECGHPLRENGWVDFIFAFSPYVCVEVFADKVQRQARQSRRSLRMIYLSFTGPALQLTSSCKL